MLDGMLDLVKVKAGAILAKITGGLITTGTEPHSYGLYSNGLCRYGLRSYGICSDGLYSYGLYSYGLYIVMACI